ncbi:MAG: amidohydrolase family protein [Ginsengibacter sp.]
MNYRKLKADYLFTGFELLSNNEVLITKPKGEIVSIVNSEDAGDDVEIFTGIITPGFVNTHCHLELSHLKGLITEKTGLVDFVYKVINERNFAEEEIFEAITKTENEMAQNGIVAVGDICNNTLTLPQKLQHNLSYYNFIEASGWAPSVSGLRWERSKTCLDEFTKENLTASVVPHAPYSVSDELWERITPFFENKTVTIHNQETIFENEFFLKGTGDLLRMYEKLNIDNSFFSPSRKTSLQTYFHKLSKAASVILVHNTFTSQADIDYVNKNKPGHQLVAFCVCPNANMYIEDTLPPVELLVKNDCFITIGTDSLASNHSLNILDEMKTIQHYFPILSLEKILQWATFNGAKALQMDEAIGSFEKGKKPGVILLENVDGLKLKKESTCKRLL